MKSHVSKLGYLPSTLWNTNLTLQWVLLNIEYCKGKDSFNRERLIANGMWTSSKRRDNNTLYQSLWVRRLLSLTFPSQ